MQYIPFQFNIIEYSVWIDSKTDLQWQQIEVNSAYLHRIEIQMHFRDFS